MNKMVSILICSILMANTSTIVFANNLNTKLPDVQIEKSDFEPLDNMPDPTQSLKEVFDNAVEELVNQGFGENNYPNGFGELNAPEGFGKSAEQLFSEKYGELWYNQPMDTSKLKDNMKGKPSDSEFKNIINNAKAQHSLNDIISEYKSGFDRNIGSFEKSKAAWNEASSTWANMLPSKSELLNYKPIDTDALAQQMANKQGDERWKATFYGSKAPINPIKDLFGYFQEKVGGAVNSAKESLGLDVIEDKFKNNFVTDLIDKYKDSEARLEKDMYKEVYSKYYGKSGLLSAFNKKNVEKASEVNRIFKENGIYDTTSSLSESTKLNDPIYMGKLIEQNKDLLKKENPKLFGDIDTTIQKYKDEAEKKGLTIGE
ncbi:hypothetical protein [Alkaliphilus sp. B6464]|uniref:hypothetical protein n=1 Tax=Alkaliphilus sp. B6464 TaxID=2731219 RepID=UPI001BAD2BE3|nr:hypothetical protein [Alkaliphilus sp. B6464]QUH22118.1 hypothetical protein HYG84_19620 [Alkaliphilus sp. B6464]